jgi:hypothetical protein
MPFRGSAATPEGAVGAGIDSILVQDGRIITFASDVSYSVDYELEGIRTLGFWGDREFKSLGMTGNANIGTYLLRGKDVEGALGTPGVQADGTVNINSAGLFDFAMLDLFSLEVLITLLGCKLGNEDVQFPARGLNTKATQWRFSRPVPGLSTS